MVDKYRFLKTNRHSWALTNCGILRSVHCTRTAAIKEAERLSGGDSWDKLKSYMEVRKVTVTEGWR